MAAMSSTATLDRVRYLSLATFRMNGAEVRTPIWFAAVGEALYVVSAGDAGKVKRLRRSSEARIAPCDARGHVTGSWRDVTARIVTDPEAIARADAALTRKYGWQKRVLTFFSRLSGRIHRRAWIVIEL
jgi:PPOX class probable F420-dependent enzyme